MRFSEQARDGFGVALNEATLLGIEVVDDLRRVSLSFALKRSPADDEADAEQVSVRIVLEPVGRIAASLRHGPWDDDGALVEPFELEHLEEIVEGFGQAETPRPADLVRRTPRVRHGRARTHLEGVHRERALASALG